MDFSGTSFCATGQKHRPRAGGDYHLLKERKKAIEFSDGYYKSGLLVMVKANNNDIKDVKDPER